MAPSINALQSQVFLNKETTFYVIFYKKSFPDHQNKKRSNVWVSFVGERFPHERISQKVATSCDRGTYCDGLGTFVAENGDKLYFLVKGRQMIPNTGENCHILDTCFNDPAEFIGGTGKFTGATGFFYINAFIYNG